MASSVDFNTIGFFNSILPLNQTNWADYFAPAISDGIIAGINNEMQVFANSSGMYVYVKSGECRVRSHRGVLSAQATLDIAAADLSYDRKDLVVARVTYGNPSTMVVAVKTGTPSATPTVPAVTQTAGDVWEIPLAEVTVGSGVVTITANDVADRRFVYANEGASMITLDGVTSLNAENDRNYRITGTLESLTIILPNHPSNSWKCSVVFFAGSTFPGVNFLLQNGTTPTICTDDNLAMQSVGYHIDIIWGGAYYWVIAHTNQGTAIKWFTGTSVGTDSHWEYRNNTAIGSLTVGLPDIPAQDFITVVAFTSASSFSGVSFVRDGSAYYPKLQGVALSLASVRYNLTIFWDGAYFWCNSEAA